MNQSISNTPQGRLNRIAALAGIAWAGTGCIADTAESEPVEAEEVETLEGAMTVADCDQQQMECLGRCQCCDDPLPTLGCTMECYNQHARCIQDIGPPPPPAPGMPGCNGPWGCPYPMVCGPDGNSCVLQP